MIKHIKELSKLELSSSTSCPNLAKFETIANLCLLYSHNRDYEDRERGEVEKLAECYPVIYNKLVNIFFAELFVYRPQIAKVDTWIKSGVMGLLSGYAGSGKSTILYKIIKDFEEVNKNANVSIHYINLKEHFGTLTKRETTDAVCAIIHGDIVKRRLRNASEEDRTAWILHYIENHPKYDRVNIWITQKLIILGRPDNDMERLKLLKEDPKLSQMMEECTTNDPTAIGTQDLVILLKYLVSRGNLCIVIIDNIDRYNSRLQGEVIEKAIDFATNKLAVPIVAIRTENLVALPDIIKGDYILDKPKICAIL